MSENNGPSSSTEKVEKPAATSAQVYAVHGVEPEVQAYAMAKYSRSALSMKESLREINEQKAEKFLNTFYFQYGHRSIADLAHIALAIEKLSILAAIAVVDEQRWDGQERSTRYQDFRKSGYHIPDFGDDAEALRMYREAMDGLFGEYERLSQQMFEHLASRTPKPADMKQDAYERTLRARAFDVSRYLLPLATNTSLGEIVNARTLETQVARLLSHSHREVRALGAALKQAAVEPAYNTNCELWRMLVDDIRRLDPNLAERAAQMLLKEVRVAPTLVKYADPNSYLQQTSREMEQAARELLKDAPVEQAGTVELLDSDTVEIEIPSMLLYGHSHYPYKQVRRAVEGLAAKRRDEITDLGLRHRGKHDELLSPFNAGHGFRFDILMDLGGFRDMHRHRRCVQVGQAFTTAHGYETPQEIGEAGIAAQYDGVMQRAAEQSANLRARVKDEAEETSQYLIPLAYRKRTLFAMDFAEVVYIAELRTGPAGHYSYRRVAYEMYEAVARKHPSLAKHFRVTDVRQPVDLLKR